MGSRKIRKCGKFRFWKSQAIENLVHFSLIESCTCGDLLDVPPYNLNYCHCCNDPMEPIYYATQDTKGGLIVTKDICSVCYVFEKLVAK